MQQKLIEKRIKERKLFNMNLHLTDKKSDAQIKIIVITNKNIKEDKKLLETLNFKGEDGACVLLPESQKIYVACENDNSDELRQAIATATKKFDATNFKSAQIEVKENLREIVEGIELGSYSFTKYKSKKDDKKEKNIDLVVSKLDDKTIKTFEDGVTLSNSVNMVRDFVNTPPEDFYPKVMAKVAKKIANENSLDIKIFDDEYFSENNMGAISAVGRASRHGSRLIHLTYKPKNAKKKVVLVGKGLTYDSGGLSLKPSDFMVSMKADKSGGCAVLGIIQAASKMNLPVEIHGVIGAVENMIGGDAYKPDDVLTAKNGKTIEVKNTDAEGRLVLADCLCYAQDEIKDIDLLVDYATLTGACVVGVGHYTTGIMGNNEKLKNEMRTKALDSGELATTLDFNKFLKKTLKSEIADICNISNTRYGGALTAGLFLSEFIKEEYKEKWLHCDIAGPAYVEHAWGYNPHGGSGAGVRFSIEYLKSL
jgi:leucyl aminopeptidase